MQNDSLTCLSDCRVEEVNSSSAVYAAFTDGTVPDPALAACYLERQLSLAAALPCDLPDDPADLPVWASAHHARITELYRGYLKERQQGGARRYFANLAHALYFIRNVAPTKLVDGAWLYGVLRHWQDNDFHPLVKTYVEELGAGVPDKNHVALYQRLLDHYGCATTDGLSDPHFTQGAIQLALGYGPSRFEPEMVGYNLGYEQLPLHLLITSYELNELGVDPYYFTLHVTVDNASTGHAHDAIAALQRMRARDQDPDAYYARVRAGYRLNALGESSTSVIGAFDLETELVRILSGKAIDGKDMHGDYCRVEGKTINVWLATPGQIHGLLSAFQRTGWIQRGRPAAESRFWRLIQGARAEMFGVFSAYEQQVLADWIATPANPQQAALPTARVMSFRARQRALEHDAVVARPRPARPVIRYNYGAGSDATHSGSRLRQLEQAVALAPDKQAAITVLIACMSPAAHHSPAGLMATRMFAQLAC